MSEKKNKAIDVQGHRGWRGLFPENTIEGFTSALELGVTTLEMDLHISKDKQVVISHDGFFSHHYSIDSMGIEITKEAERQHNLYEMDYHQIVKYDVGSKFHEGFPEQKKFMTIKPLLRDLFKIIEKKVEEESLKKPFYNIEIKRNPKNDGIFHPSVEEFVELVLGEIKASGIKDRIYVQSFDIETLQTIKRVDEKLPLVLLIENERSPEANIEDLGFNPDVYSPYFQLVDQEVVDFCHKRSMKLVPWTVNKAEDMEQLLQIGVDGIISDYPGILIEVMKKLNYPVL